jgi:hypothetical protein
VPEALATALVREARPKRPIRWPPLHIAHLLEAGFLSIGTELIGIYEGRRYRATIVNEDGQLRLDDGHVCKSPSGAAKLVTGNRSGDGWRFWFWEDQNRHLFPLADLRTLLLERLTEELRRRGSLV